MAIKKTELIKLIKMKCKDDCCCGDQSEVRACNITRCPLHSVRLGIKDVEMDENLIPPKKTRKPMSEEHKKSMKEGREKAKLNS